LRKSYLILFILGLVAAVVGGLVYLLFPVPRGGGDFLNGIELQGNIHRLKTLILSFGLWAPFISAFLMVAQSVVLFLPAFPIFVVNALVFGPFYGLLLSWSSAVTGSMVCFSIAKTLGRPVVERLVKKDHLETADRALKKYQKYVILLFGFVPVVSFDVISYAAGLTLLAYWEFLLLVCIAQVPSALFYTLLVHRIDRGTLDIYWIVAAVLFFLLGFGSTAVRAYLNRRSQKGLPESAP
jgi:uncharacterized membrane protein YdjX (TVP38/TMEM64 family)